MTGERGTRWRPGDLPVFVVPIFVGFLQLVGSSGADVHMPYPHMLLDALAYALLTTGPFALLFRRRYPTVALSVVMTATVLYLLRGYVFGPVFLSPVVAIVATVGAGRRVAAWAIPGGALTVLGVVSPFTPFGPFRLAYWSFGHTLVVFTWLVVLLTGAEILRVRRERADEVRRTRAEEERRQASEERLRIARELHDVLAHNISMINVQAGVALHLMDERPEQARTALSAIKEASKEALTEVRSVLGVLRQVDESAPRSPAAGLARLDDLLARARVAGITVHTETTGEPRPLPAGVDLAAFRIIQEALTNVTRHAGPGVTATVRVRYGDEGLFVEVLDDGRGAPGDLPRGGNGIPGMRERVAALGGEISTGPRTDAVGFHVRARLPVPHPAGSPEPQS
ncbi:sensor histidine kinase [Actinoallomurus iriomotensis]|uniref:histidine kinase n=1 Tax=Actinoallomurus iriomotensis TaxID=478107 RepID=A0A9W6SD27_9ACTN|nr:sensor histidine kinase [Actinoallomurus iriomotensis]GLY91364.1 two-component sensor histidine kinase [Actinoallomurus iriomotensis]